MPTMHHARASFEAGDLNHTITLSRRLVDTNPDNSEAIYLLVRALIYNSYTDYDTILDRSEALQVTRTYYIKHRSSSIAQGIHALALQTNGQTTEATRLALQAIRGDHTNMPARLALSLSYASQGIFQAALREAEFAVKTAEATHHDWRMDAHRVHAIALSDLGRYTDASQAINKAINYNRKLIPLHFERALYALQVGDTNSATGAYFQVVAFDDSNAKARLRLCEVSSSLSERSAALRYCQEAAERAPGWSDVWYQLGREYFLRGDLTHAKEALGRCTTLQVLQNVPIEERRFECWYLQGQAAEVLGDCQTLVPLYEQFQEMAAQANIAQTWVYPPEGPPLCAVS